MKIRVKQISFSLCTAVQQLRNCNMSTRRSSRSTKPVTAFCDTDFIGSYARKAKSCKEITTVAEAVPASAKKAKRKKITPQDHAAAKVKKKGKKRTPQDLMGPNDALPKKALKGRIKRKPR